MLQRAKAVDPDDAKVRRDCARFTLLVERLDDNSAEHSIAPLPVLPGTSAVVAGAFERMRLPPMRTHFILYVAHQDRSTAFYASVLDLAPSLYTPGMTEFAIGADTVLGVMPQSGILRLLAPALDSADVRTGDWRGELYLVVDNPDAYHARALAEGADELSPLQPRDWGHAVAYSRDPDGYILAFASDITR